MTRNKSFMYWEKYLIPSELVVELMKQNKFIPITFATTGVMKKTLYENIKSPKYPLEYDKKAYLRLITMQTPKTTTKVDPTYWYAVFEFKIFCEFIWCLQSADGSINALKVSIAQNNF